jgi:hypothetical protein
MLPLRAVRAIAPPIPVVELVLIIPALLSILPLVLVSVTSRPELLMFPVVIS